MSKARLVITVLVVEGRKPAEVARAYGVSRSWVYELLARYSREGQAAFQPRSRRPKTSPAAIPEATVELILELRKDRAGQGLDAGAATIAWHLEHHHQKRVSTATISRYLTRRGMVVPQPRKRPKASYTRFEAALPNMCWQADVTHYRRSHAPKELWQRLFTEARSEITLGGYTNYFFSTELPEFSKTLRTKASSDVQVRIFT